ncbi:trifunctional serine/threonine-protein kinase/ATP-binding protein/sensor histidine kinase [Spirosoma fluviale]|uniref:histidine kinase n=1 Tax=Spirosoma fluviale TaxID=1597977 RepID=A0A286GVX3_9BACT|nr:ATP-binding sensor histidine kinase [Spirosoma fluviale]SOD99688.1 Predicted ATPase [Spirosoma fluviale]
MIREDNIPGYKVDKVIYEGKRTVIYRAIRSVDKKNVLFKTLANPYPGATEIAYLKKEYSLLSSIDVNGVCKAYDLLNYKGRPIIVLEDFNGISLADYLISNRLDLDEFLDIAIKLTTILGDLHALNIMHKDINPKNVIINIHTKDVFLIDFRLATKLSLERASARNPYILEGTLPYISPEQTGRMNRSTDYRTDFYSLGITFYEILLGILPFTSEEPMELVYYHLAKNIVPPAELNSKIPKAISDIILKLTEKNAENRYQSASGLKYDLDKCLTYVINGPDVLNFSVGEKDIYSKFNIPEKLYGRDHDIESLLSLFKEVSGGGCRFALISGTAGVGKTALINEIHKPTVKRNGYFVSGKFDQFKANSPFSAFALAFAELVKDLVSEPSYKLGKIKTELINVLGLNAPVLVDLVPEFEYIIGKQGPVQPLNPAESKNRFFFTLREFIRVFATHEHPLTIFLDDLQWSDDSSLRLITDLISTGIPYLFIIGAYRDNETGPGHPLKLTIEKVKELHEVSELKLSNLEETHVNQLVADTLKVSSQETKALATIIYKRTVGNPFYVYELFKTTFTQGLVFFDYLSGKWTWNIKKIAEHNISSNVVDFMATKLSELSEDCRELLELAACIGNTFDLRTLSLLTKKNAFDTSVILWPALEDEIIVPTSEAYRLVIGDDDFGVLYKFHHDRIQQSVYQRIAEDSRKVLHLTIGRMLLETIPDSEKSEHIIEIVRHFNEGIDLIDETEKLNLAHMNLLAGRKAQSAVAYTAALAYFKKGIDLMPDSSWDLHHQLVFDLYAGYAQNAYQTNDYNTAERCMSLLLEKARTKLEKVEILSFRIRQYNTVGKSEEAIRCGIEGLGLLGYILPEKPSSAVVLKEVLLAKWLLGTRKPAALLDSPILQDPEKKAAARLLTEIGPSAFVLGNDSLYGLTQLKIVNLSMQHGNCEESAYAYVAFGAVLSEAFGDLKSAESFGQLGLALNEKLGDIEYRCRVIAAYGVLTHHFNNHWNTTGEFFKKGIEAGYLSGDLFYLAYCATNCTVWQPSLDLPTSLSEQKKYLKVVLDTNYTDAIDSANMNLQLTKNLMGLTEGLHSMNDADFDETHCLEQMTQRKYSSGIGMYHIHKAYLYLFYGQYEKSYEAVKQADQFVKSLVSLINLTRLSTVSFFASSGFLLYGTDPPKDLLKKRMKKELAKMKKWADYKPTNFQHMQHLMEAEMANIDDDFLGATKLYEKAIRLASENDWPADEAFANELAAKFFSRHGIDTASSGYWKDAYYLFNKWGAQGKIKFLREAYPQLFKTIRNGVAENGKDLIRDEGGEPVYALDVDTIVKSSQAISGEIELKSLLSKMMNIIMMNAGAENGMLLLKQDDRILIQASASADEVKTMQNSAVEGSKELPQTIINYVSHLQESVVLYDAASQGKFRNDDYIVRNQTKSILCSPIVFLNKLYGIVYLENNISVGAFTEERLKIVSLLSSQMAISIQNAILYSNLENKVQERTVEIQAQRDQTQQALTELKSTQTRLIQKEKMASLGELTAGIAHEIQNPLNFVNNFAEISAEIVDDLRLEQSKPARAPELESNLLAFLKDNLSKIHHHGQRVSNIVKGMLEHSRIGSGEMQPTNLGALADEYMYLAYNGLKSKDKEFSCKLITDYDSAVDTVNVVSQDVSRVFLNLFSNAFYAVRERKKQEGDDYQPVVSVRISQANGFVEIVIADNGIGMSQSVQQKVFQPFFTTKPTGEGTGLGLSLSYDIITKGHRGGLLVQSREGEGTEFVIQLPTSAESVVL